MDSKGKAKVHQSSQRRKGDNVTQKLPDPGVNDDRKSVCNVDKNPVTILSAHRISLQNQQRALSQTWSGNRQMQKQTQPALTVSGLPLNRDNGSANVLQPPVLGQSYYDTRQGCFDQVGARPKVRDGSQTGHGSQALTASVQTEDRCYQPEKYEDQRREVNKEPTMLKHEECFHICLGVRITECPNQDVPIACDVVMFMKWHYILRSPKMLSDVNQFLAKQKIGYLSPDSTLQLQSWISESFLSLSGLTQLITDIVGHYGSSLAVECVYSQKGEAIRIVETLNSFPFVTSTHILYSLATNSQSIYLVFDERNKTLVFELVEKACPNLMVQVSLPHVWAVMAENTRFQERLGLTDVSITLYNDVHAGQIICQISGPLSRVKRAENELKMYRKSLQCTHMKLSKYLYRACQNLQLLDILQERIDSHMPRMCLVQMSEHDGPLYLYTFNDKDFDVGVDIIKDNLGEMQVPWCVKSTDKPSVQEIKKEMMDNGIDHVTVFEENGSLVIVGLKDSTQLAKEFIGKISASGRDNTQTNFIERRFVPKNEVLDTLGLLAEDLAKVNRVKLMRSEAAEEHIFEFSGEKGKMVKSLNEFDDIRKQLSMEKFSMDKDFVTSRSGADILAMTQSRYGVKLMTEEVDKYSPKSANRGVRHPKATLDVDGDRFVWSFPTGRNLILDLLDIENCHEPDLLIVLVENKTGNTTPTMSTRNKHNRMKQEVHIPTWKDGDLQEQKKVKHYFKRVLTKVFLDGYHSVGLSLQPKGQWPFNEFLEMVLVPVLKHLLAFDNKQGLNFFILCATSLNQLKKTEASIRKSIDPDFVENSIQTVIVKGELNQFEADVLVNTTSPILDLNYGNVSAAILKSAGPGIQEECFKKYPKEVQGSSLAVTGGHKLQCNHVFHGALQSYKPTNDMDCLVELRGFLKNCLEKANELNVSSIAFPVIGSGKLGYPVKLVASEMFSGVERLRQEKEDSSLRFVYFVVYTKDKETFEIFKNVQEDMVKYKHQPSNVAANQSIETKGKSYTQTIGLTIIGMDSDIKKAKAALQKKEQSYHEKQSKDGTLEGKVQQYMPDVSSHQYSALMKLFPAKMEEIRDSGVEVKWMENRINLSGDFKPATKAVQQMKEMVKELTSMYHIQFSIAGTEIDIMESNIRKVRRQKDGIQIIHDKIMSVVHLYGNSTEDVKTAAKLLGYKTGMLDKNESKTKENDEDLVRSTGAEGLTDQHSFSYSRMSRHLMLYQLGSLIVGVYVGDLLESPAECIVNAANADLNYAGEVASRIALKAGADMKKQCYEISQNDSMKAGSVVKTSAGAMSDRYKCILHTVCPDWFDYKPITEISLSQCMEDIHAAILNTFIKAEELKLTSIALPAINSDIFRVPREICALQYAHALLEFMKREPASVKAIYFVDKDYGTVSVIQDAFKCMLIENMQYNVNFKVYFDKHQKQRSKSKEKGHLRDGDKDAEMRHKENKGSGGMVYLQPFYRIESEKMCCFFTSHHEIHIYTGNILELDGIDAIVCSEDKSWSAAGMVARRLVECGGQEYKREKLKVKSENRLDDGNVVVTMGGQNKYPWVIHVIVPSKKPPEALKDLSEDIFHSCHKKGFKSTVMSLLSAGSGRSNPKVCSEMLLSAYQNFCVRHPGYRFILHLVNIDKDKTKVLQSVFKENIDKQQETWLDIKLSHVASAGTMDLRESNDQSKSSQGAGRLDADLTKKHGRNNEVEIQRKMLVPSGSLGQSGGRQEKLTMEEMGQTELSGRMNVAGGENGPRSLCITGRERQDLNNENKEPISIELSGRRQSYRVSLTNQDQLSANKEEQTRDLTKGEIFKNVQEDMEKYKHQPSNVAANQSIETKGESNTQTMGLTIIGMDSNIKKAKAALQKKEQSYHGKQSKDETLDGKVQQYMSDVSSHQWLGYKTGVLDKNESKTKENDEDLVRNTGTEGPIDQQSFSYSRMSRHLMLYQLGSIIVRVYVGDLLESPAECIVNTANADLNHAGEVASRIALKAGADMKKQCYELSQNVSLRTGSVVKTSAGAMSDRYKCILHTVGPDWFDYKPITKESLSQCMEDLHAAILNTFMMAEKSKLTSIALPAISSDIFRVPREICALQYAHALLEFMKREPASVKAIYFVDKDYGTVSVIQDAFKCMLIENMQYNVNFKVYFDEHQKQWSKSKEKGHLRDGDKDAEMRHKENKGSGGMVYLQPFYRIESEKMCCFFTSHHEIHIYTGNILELDGIDAIVCSEDKSWSAAGMVARRLVECGGQEYKREKLKVKSENRLDDGNVVVTMGGQNKYPWVIHAIVPTKKPPEALKDLSEDIFHSCHKKGFKSTVMSLLSTGSGRSNPKVCSEMLLSAYQNFCVRHPGYRFILHLVNIDKDKTKVLQSVFKENIDKQQETQLDIKLSHVASAGTMDLRESNDQSKSSQGAGRLDADLTKKHGRNNEVEIQRKMLVPSGSLGQSGERQEKLTMEEMGQTELSGRMNVAGVENGPRSLCITGRERQDLNNDNKEPISIELSGRRQSYRVSLTNQDQLSANKEEQTRDLTKGEGSADTDESDKDENCVICMDTLDVPKTLKCGHMFCTECIEGSRVKQACPTCFTVCGVITGDQPDGKVEIQLLRTSMAGYEKYGSIGVSYRFDSGNQGPNHPRPGAWYKGISRTAYLPNTDEGQMICAMLKLAFERRLVFTIGTSRTTGQEGVITWNDIHHKTDHRPNEQFGYPDDTYLTRVKEELAAKGVTEKEIDEQFLNELKNNPSYCKSFSVKT